MLSDVHIHYFLYVSASKCCTGMILFSSLQARCHTDVLGMLYTGSCTVMHHLTTGISSEKCIVRQFCCCANVIECTYTNLETWQ